mmetsp:Transcript_6422/g.9457  ORF Transcript_6422/g.9457 Transcript_6422/m.9457 type:complete len:130 (-) Transcript_6422:80-469(-)
MSSPSNNNSSSIWRQVAATLGASGVALGAIGAHAFKDTLTKRNSLTSWQTATMYQLFHATALLTMSSEPSSDLPKQLLSLGTVLFSGSIYCLSLNIGPKAILGPMTPVGGLLMIGGWVAVAFSPKRKSG